MCVRGLVSVITPVYNSARFLAETVESVLAQTYTCWELMLVDDGSTDGVTAIALDYAARYPGKVQYLEHPGHTNMGMCASRNLGIRLSKGEYIATLDSDDVWLPPKLQEQVAIMEAHPEAGLVFGRTEDWYDWEGTGQVTGRNSITQRAPGGRLYAPPTLLKLSYPLGTAGAPPPSDWLLRRSTMIEVEGFEEEFDSHPLYEDQAFLSKIYLNIPIFVGESCWDRSRIHDSSCCALAERNGIEDQCRRLYFEWLERYLRRKNVRDPAIWRLFRKQTWAYRHPRLAAAKKRARRFAKRILLRYANRLLTRGTPG